MTEVPPRVLAQRKQDTLERLRRDVDCWVATTDGAGSPYLVPLSFRWDGTSLLVSTPAASPTGRNLLNAGAVRVAVGETRDVVLLDCSVTAAIPAADVAATEGDAFAAKAGFDPRSETGYLYFRIQPHRVQAWREANELAGRDLMRAGRWLA